jgi:hypothetical protein
MDDNNDDNNNEEGERQSGDEVAVISDLNTLTRQSLPSTVTIKRHCIHKKPQKEHSETTWTQNYFNITLLDNTWVNLQKKSHPVL